MKKILFIKFMFVLTILNYQYINAQQSFRLIPESSTMKIEGTSSLHDWEMNVEKIKCDVDITIGNPSVNIFSVSFIGESASILSHNSIMDNKAHKALKTDKYPLIKFNLISVHKVPVIDGIFRGIASGEITLAGISKKIAIPYTGIITGKDKITITGSKKIDMTEYGIQPPTAMLGTLKTGNEVTVTFSLNIKQL